MKKIIYAMKDLLKNYFNWHGRLSRTGYMWSWAGVLAVSAGLIAIRKATVFLASFLCLYDEPISKIMKYPICIWNIVMFLPILFATMRRYHDSGKAGWKAVLFNLLSPVFIAWGAFIGMFVVIAFVFGGGYMVTADADVKMGRLLGILALSAILLLAGIGGFILNIIYMFRKSDPNENKYGKPTPFTLPGRVR